MQKTLVSACLLGVKSRFDGESRPCQRLMDMAEEGCYVPVCPEQLGGLPSPRSPVHFVGGDGRSVLAGNARVVDADGVDRTEAFLKGARETLRIAQILGIKRAILKSKSPSCGSGMVYILGENEPCLEPGWGVAAALLAENGIAVESELEYSSEESS
ncbi:DUF523 domain-containing protein [Candidatus Hydrogenedentota bacterium]